MEPCHQRDSRAYPRRLGKRLRREGLDAKDEHVQFTIPIARRPEPRDSLVVILVSSRPRPASLMNVCRFARLTVPPGEEAVGQVSYRQAAFLRGERRNSRRLDCDQPSGTLQVWFLGGRCLG